jgi:penicillin-binding protein 2
MAQVNVTGTGRLAFKGAEYVAAGKTGTAQVIGIRQNEKYDEDAIARRHRDHSLYVAFAPVDSPKIALAVIVENAGFGAKAAAPMARKVLDYHLLGKLPDDTDPADLLTPIEEAEIDDTPPAPVLDAEAAEDEAPVLPAPGVAAPPTTNGKPTSNGKPSSAGKPTATGKPSATGKPPAAGRPPATGKTPTRAPGARPVSPPPAPAREPTGPIGARDTASGEPA